MSNPIFADDVLFYQRLLASMGYYTDTLDGIWGSNTDDADQAFEADARALRDEFGELDSRTEGNILSMHIAAQRLARRFFADLAADGFGRTVRILSGTRTYAAQNKLFAKGRFGNPPPKVTNARGGFSNHNFGIAWDIGIFEDGVYYTGATQQQVDWYNRAHDTVNMDGLEWGGDISREQDETPRLRIGEKSALIRPQAGAETAQDHRPGCGHYNVSNPTGFIYSPHPPRPRLQSITRAGAWVNSI